MKTLKNIKQPHGIVFMLVAIYVAVLLSMAATLLAVYIMVLSSG